MLSFLGIESTGVVIFLFLFGMYHISMPSITLSLSLLICLCTIFQVTIASTYPHNNSGYSSACQPYVHSFDKKTRTATRYWSMGILAEPCLIDLRAELGGLTIIQARMSPSLKSGNLSLVAITHLPYHRHTNLTGSHNTTGGANKGTSGYVILL